MAASTVFRSPPDRVDLANHYNWWTYVPGTEYAWGEELTPDGRWMANTWQGEFPVANLGSTGTRARPRSAASRPTATACST